MIRHGVRSNNQPTLDDVFVEHHAGVVVGLDWHVAGNADVDTHLDVTMCAVVDGRRHTVNLRGFVDQRCVVTLSTVNDVSMCLLSRGEQPATKLANLGFSQVANVVLDLVEYAYELSALVFGR